MKPFLTLAQARTPEGSLLALLEHDGDFFLKLNGRQLMSTTATAAEVSLAKLACNWLGRHTNPRILIGGLGFGFTLRQVLKIVRPRATVHVAELIPEVLAWNREFLKGVNGMLVGDHRVSVFVEDVAKVIGRSGHEADRYDAILLDVDNGPVAMVQGGNSCLYDRRGLDRIKRALNPGGKVAIWSADEDRPFFERLVQAGFEVEVAESKAHENAKRAAHRIYVARCPGVSIGPRSPR